MKQARSSLRQRRAHGTKEKVGLAYLGRRLLSLDKRNNVVHLVAYCVFVEAVPKRGRQIEAKSRQKHDSAFSERQLVSRDRWHLC